MKVGLHIASRTNVYKYSNTGLNDLIHSKMATSKKESINFYSIFLLAVIIQLFFTSTAFTLSDLDSPNFDQSDGEVLEFTSQSLDHYRSLLPQSPDSVITMLIPRLASYLESKETDIAARSLYLLGLSYYFNGKYILSNFYYHLVFSLEEDLVSDNLLEAVNNNKGINYDILQVYDRSIFYYRESSRIADNLNNKLGVAQTDLNIGIIQYKIGDLEKAIDETRKALSKFEELEDPYHIALASMNLGSYLVFNKDKTGLNYLLRAKDMFLDHGFDFNMASVNYHLAAAYLQLNNIELSIEHAESAIAMIPESVYNNTKIESINLLISLYDLTGQPQEAIRYIDKMMKAIGDQSISGMVLPNDFWDLSLLIYLKEGMTNEVVNLLDLKASYETRTRSVIYSPIFNDYQKLKELSPEYAKLIESLFPDIESNALSEKEFQTRVLLLIVASVTLIGFYLYYRKLNSDLSEYAKLDYLIKKIDKTEINESDVMDSPTGGIRSKVNTLDKLFQEIEIYLMKDELYLDASISRELVAKELFTNVKYVSESIKKNTNLSFIEYINHLKISKALKILKSGNADITMGDLCDLSGYTSEATFYRNFKSIVGTSPNKFQRKIMTLEEKQRSSMILVRSAS